ncbi:MAG: hypothetical protein ACI91O_000863 [Candidatus Poriferisodalaceae bacterium]|jgi:hypothetical protein
MLLTAGVSRTNLPPIEGAMGMKGNWAEGIRPRNFTWVVKDRLAVSERPGGYGENHRRVRRQEEIIWILQQGFDFVVSLIPSNHNLHNYEELGLPYLHRPWPPTDQLGAYTERLWSELQLLLDDGKRVLIHKEEVGERISGAIAGYLLSTGLVPTGPQATAITERIIGRQLGAVGRGIVELAARPPADAS